MKRIFAIIALVALAVSCGQQSDTCTVKGVVKGPYEADGATLSVMLMGQAPETVEIQDNGTFTYSLPADVTSPLRISLREKDSRRPKYVVLLVPEGGTVRVVLDEESTFKGGRINRELNRFNQMTRALNESFSELDRNNPEDEAKAEAMILKLHEACEKTFRANTDNWVGLMALTTRMYELSLAELDEHLEAAADFIRENPHIQAYRTTKVAEDNTSEGKPFVDFTGTNPDGKSVSLSDFVGQGNYTLVDFWASWCAPCRQEMPNIRELWETYAGRGLQVVSVAVWDGDNTASRKAIEELGMAWNHIFVGIDRKPTEIYGISGIPHLILFAPDGTVYRRGLRGEELKDTVSELFN